MRVGRTIVIGAAVFAAAAAHVALLGWVLPSWRPFAALCGLGAVLVLKYLWRRASARRVRSADVVDRRPAG
jgi:hypothetical protein